MYAVILASSIIGLVQISVEQSLILIVVYFFIMILLVLNGFFTVFWIYNVF